MLQKIDLTYEEIANAVDYLSRIEYGDMTLEQEQLVAKYEYNKLVDELNNMIVNEKTKEDIKDYVHDIWLDYQISDCTEFLIQRQLKQLIVYN